VDWIIICFVAHSGMVYLIRNLAHLIRCITVHHSQSYKTIEPETIIPGEHPLQSGLDNHMLCSALRNGHLIRHLAHLLRCIIVHYSQSYIND
jgi:hypothetical protein